MLAQDGFSSNRSCARRQVWRPTVVSSYGRRTPTRPRAGRYTETLQSSFRWPPFRPERFRHDCSKCVPTCFRLGGNQSAAKDRMFLSRRSRSHRSKLKFIDCPRSSPPSPWTSPGLTGGADNYRLRRDSERGARAAGLVRQAENTRVWRRSPGERQHCSRRERRDFAEAAKAIANVAQQIV